MERKMLVFEDIVKIQRTNCKKCLTFLYSLPCQVNKNIAKHLESFGKPIYPLKSVKLLRIDTKDGYKIDSKIGKNAIKFAIPKELEGKADTWRKAEFEVALISWLVETLDMPIVVQQKESEENSNG